MTFDNPAVVSAAVIVELADGKRMAYSFQPGQPLTFEFDVEDERWPFVAALRTSPTYLTVRGVAAGGVIWDAPMPGRQPEIGIVQGAIEA